MGTFQPWHLIPALVVAAPFVALVSVPFVLARRSRRRLQRPAGWSPVPVSMVIAAAGMPDAPVCWDSRVGAHRVGHAFVACTAPGTITLWGEWGSLSVPDTQLPLYAQAVRSAIQGMPV